MFDSLLDALGRELQAALSTAVAGLVTTARTRLEGAVTEVAEERVKGLAEVAKERAASLAEVDARRGELHREIEAMQTHQAKQEGRIELNIGGFHFQTSVQTLRRVPHTFFDAYFSGRYAQDVCSDGSIFVDRDGTHFGHVLEYMRDGHVSVAEAGAQPSVSLLRALKREFGFYCIELCAKQEIQPEQPEMAYVMGGSGNNGHLSNMERYDAQTIQWSTMAAMSTSRGIFGACVVVGEVYVIGGVCDAGRLASVEKYSPLSDTWSTVTLLPAGRSSHAAVAMGSHIYVLGGALGADHITTDVLRYDTRQGTWTQATPMPDRKTKHAACAIGSDIYVFGGSFGGGRLDASVFKLDTVSGAWITLAPMPRACFCRSAIVLDGLVYILGGQRDNAVLCFDPATEVWSVLSPNMNKRKYGSSFVVGECLYFAGGKDAMSSVERYDVASDTWTAVADMLEGRSRSRAVTIGSAVTVEEQNHSSPRPFDNTIELQPERYSPAHRPV
jgi:hypothetical protein